MTQSDSITEQSKVNPSLVCQNPKQVGLKLKDFKDELVGHLRNSHTLPTLLANNSATNPEQFIAKVVDAVLSSQTLQSCSMRSIVQSCLKSAQLGLPVDVSGYSYIVPRKVKIGGEWTVEAIFQIGYKGYLELAKRNKSVKSIDSFLVFTEELERGNFKEIRGSESMLVYKPDYSIKRTDENVALAVGVITYKNGGREWEVMTREEIEKAKHVSIKKDTFGQDKFSPWTEWWGEMAKKTVLRRLLKKCCLINVDSAIQMDDEEMFGKNVFDGKPAKKTINGMLDEVNAKDNIIENN